MILPNRNSYDDIYNGFSWDIPEYYNIASDVCDRHVERKTPALIFDLDSGNEVYSFQQLQEAANQFANVLAKKHISIGDQIAIVAQPCFAIPVAHIGAWKAGVVSCAAATLFAADALAFRFNTSKTKLVVTDFENLSKVEEAVKQAHCVTEILVFSRCGTIDGSFWKEISDASKLYNNVLTRSNDAAFLNFTSGTTGLPKGVLAPHSHMLGQGAAMEFLYNFPEPGDVMWSPADWAWLAGQMCTLMAGLFLGMTVIARPREGFDAKDAYRILAEHKVTHTLLIPTMMKLMRQVDKVDQLKSNLCVKVVATGGEPCGAELYHWCREVLDAPLNETFGQTECATMICNNQMVMDAPFGCLGKSTPGLHAAIIDDSGKELPAGETGEIAARTPHPIIFSSYLGNSDATKDKHINGWMRTGDLGRMDKDGYFWYVGRADDVITSSGYRIGPGEVENALLIHPSVALSAVIGLPDPDRTEIVAAYIILVEGTKPTEELSTDIRNFVRDTLARHEIPRKIVFVTELPLTTTGKIMRKKLKNQILENLD